MTIGTAAVEMKKKTVTAETTNQESFFGTTIWKIPLRFNAPLCRNWWLPDATPAERLATANKLANALGRGRLG
jgi:hypothetical protein